MRSHQVILREISKNNLDPKVAHVVDGGKLVPKNQSDFDNSQSQTLEKEETILSQKNKVLPALVYLEASKSSKEDDSVDTKLSDNTMPNTMTEKSSINKKNIKKKKSKKKNSNS